MSFLTLSRAEETVRLMLTKNPPSSDDLYVPGPHFPFKADNDYKRPTFKMCPCLRYK